MPVDKTRRCRVLSPIAYSAMDHHSRLTVHPGVAFQHSQEEVSVTASQQTFSASQRVGLAVFVAAVAATAILITMGVEGIPLPKWLLALIAIF
jgi:hypothetical protein